MPDFDQSAYIAGFAEPVRARLLQLRQELETRVPGISPCISYRMPAFRLPNGRVFIYFAAFKKHLGVYPPLNIDPPLIAETMAYRGPKGNLSFPHAQALPLDLIGRVAQALARQYETT